MGRGRTRPVVPLTDEQRKYATEHHNLIYGFLCWKGLPIDDWYDIVALGFLEAVKLYDPNRNCSFKTFSFRVMNNRCKDELAKRNQKMRARETVSFDSYFDDDCVLYELIGSNVSVEDTAISNIAASDIMSRLSVKRRATVLSQVAGFTKVEQARREKISTTSVHKQLRGVRKMMIDGGYFDESKRRQVQAPLDV